MMNTLSNFSNQEFIDKSNWEALNLFEIDELIDLGKFKINNGFDTTDDIFREDNESHQDIEISLDDI